MLTVTTEHRALPKPATGERDFGDRLNESIDALDALAGLYDAHAANTAIHWGKATAAAYGVVKLTTAPAVAGDPIAVAANHAAWLAVSGGAASNADAHHTHAFGNGRHHDLRPDLLGGADDRKWTVGQVAALTRSDAVGGTRAVWATNDAKAR